MVCRGWPVAVIVSQSSATQRSTSPPPSQQAGAAPVRMRSPARLRRGRGCPRWDRELAHPVRRTPPVQPGRVIQRAHRPGGHRRRPVHRPDDPAVRRGAPHTRRSAADAGPSAGPLRPRRRSHCHQPHGSSRCLLAAGRRTTAGLAQPGHRRPGRGLPASRRGAGRKRDRHAPAAGPTPARRPVALPATARSCSGGRRRWRDGFVASREADGDVQPTGGHGGCVHDAAVDGGDR